MIANGLESKIDWDSLGCSVCGVAYNGLEGMNLINRLNPNIIISDIIMPGKTGLELSEYVFSHHPGTIMIILTAFDKFEYAQLAIKYGVKDYILKPINKMEMVKAIKSSVNKLKVKDNSIKSISKIETMVKEVKPLVTSTLLFDIALNGNTEIAAIEDKLKYFDINIGKGAVAVFQIDKQKEQTLSNLHFLAVRNIIQSSFQQLGYNYEIKGQDNQHILISRFDPTIPDNIIKTRMIKLSNEIQQLVYDNLHLSISVGIGSGYKDLYGLHNSCTEAVNVLQYRFFSVDGIVIHIDEVKNVQEQNYYFYENNKLIETVKEGDIDNALQILEDIFLKLKGVMNEKYFKGVCINILEQLNRLLDEKTDEGGFLKVNEIKNSSTIFELKEFFVKSLSHVCEILRPDMKDMKSQTIDKVIKIINKKYFERDLSLKYVADELNISDSYLSRLFKKEIDMNFMDYLTLIRIEKAKKFLTDTIMKNSEIAYRIGFNDAGYFSQVFRKKMNMTPSEYREKCDKSKNYTYMSKS